MRQEIKEAGRAKPVWPGSDKFPLTVRVTVPEGVDCAYSVEYTLDERSAEQKDWAEDADIPKSTVGSASSIYAAPVRGLAVNVERLSGGAIFFTICDSGR